MANKKPVIFLDYFERLERAVPIIRKICAGLKEKPVIVCSNFDNTPLAIFSDLKVIYFDELLSREDYEFMDRYVFNLTQTWYLGLKPLKGITEYAGIQYGTLTEERAQRFFTTAIKRLEIILKIIERLHPQRIVLVGEAGILQNLSVLINEELNTPTQFIGVREKDISVSEAKKMFRLYTIEIITDICDNLLRVLMLRRKKNKGIFVDYRLYFELRDLREQFISCPWLVGKGLGTRLRLIKDKRLLFAPLSEEQLLKIPNVFDPFFRYWRLLKADLSFQGNFKYKNLPIWKNLEKFVRELIIYHFSYTGKNIKFLEKLYRVLEPKVVVLRDTTRVPEKTIILTARQAGIPTLVIQHGILTARNVYTKLVSDKIALWGKAGIDWYGRYGNDITKCVVTGRASYDLNHSQKSDYRKEARELFLKIGASPDKKTILYIPTNFKKVKHLLSVYYSQDSELVALKSILSTMEYLPDKQLIVKVRRFDPVDINSLMASLKGKNCSNVFIVDDIDPWVLIGHSSLVVTSRFSSVALDAVILGKPVITLNFYKREDLVPFAQRGVGLSVARPEDLYRTVKRVFEDANLRDCFAANQEGFIADYAYRLDGKSTERLLSLIKKYIMHPMSQE